VREWMIGSVLRAAEFRCVRKLHRRTPSAIDFLSPARVGNFDRDSRLIRENGRTRAGIRPTRESREFSLASFRQRERWRLEISHRERSLIV